ncbi:MAG: DUF697 domain-containing protein [Desulfobacterales bacterium]|nr:DUF697 domain-containing protein [Desulfobacterales bacterium]
MGNQDPGAAAVAVKREQAENIIKNHVLGSVGIGLIPVPLVDMLALTGVQLNMLRRLAKAYKIPFLKDKGKHMIASLLGGFFSVHAAAPLTGLVKIVPVVGQVAGVLSMPAAAGATTYAMGKVFIQHFESGGTFLNFDPEKVREYFREMYQEGEKRAPESEKTREEPEPPGAGEGAEDAGSPGEEEEKTADPDEKMGEAGETGDPGDSEDSEDSGDPGAYGDSGAYGESGESDETGEPGQKDAWAGSESAAGA